MRIKLIQFSEVNFCRFVYTLYYNVYFKHNCSYCLYLKL